MRPIEEAKANQINQEQAVADLLTSRRQEAFEELQLWWKFHQPDVSHSIDAAVGRVDRYKLASGLWITVVFTGDAEEQNGGIYLIRPDGRQIPVFHGNNYIEGDERFVDVNGDGIPEIISAAVLAGHDDEENPKRVITDAMSLDIIPLSAEQVPLLRILCDVRPFNAEPTWRWKFVDNSAGTRDVVLEQHQMGEWRERAKFMWSLEESKYKGPEGSKLDGFIASAGDIPLEQVLEFIARPQSE
jgi:hypothetical protein